MMHNHSTARNSLHRLTPPAALPSSVRFTEGERRVFRLRERDPATGKPLTVSQWAARYRMVIRGGKQFRWSNDIVPYAVFPMDCWTAPHIRKILLCWAPQTGKTNTAFNCLCYSIDQDPGPAFYVMADEKTMKRISRRRIRSMLKKTPRIAQYLSPRSDDTSTLSVHFMHGMDIMMAWATSVAELASEEARYTLGDEVDKWPKPSDKDTEAGPVSLLDQRTITYRHTKKQLYFTTPSIEPSTIWHLMKTEADVVYAYEVPCPICGHWQLMDFEHFTWPESITDPRVILRNSLAHYSCAFCSMKWDDYMRDQAVKKGRWVPGVINDKDEWEPHDPPDRPIVVAFHLPSWYSRDISLSDVVAAHLRGKEDPEKEIVFVTQHKAKPYKKYLETQNEIHILTHKTALPSCIVPAGALALTAGVDVQKFGFWFVIRAWMDDLTSHKIQHGFVTSWQDIEKVLFDTRYLIEGTQQTMGIWRAAMDTGGGRTADDVWTRTEEIYQWLSINGRGIVFGTKGASNELPGRIRPTVIEKMPRSHLPIPGGLELRIIDTAKFKGLLHWRLTRKEGETQRFYLDADTDMEYVKQFLSEKPVPRKKGRIEWVARGANHLLDCEVLAAACADREWVPSLSMLARYMQELRKQQEEAAKMIKEPVSTQTEETRRW